MVLKFKDDAICLSGATGTKLKSAIISKYYSFWWKIVSGGERRNFSLPATIVEMDAATGEIYIEETKELLLGSAGHALELKFLELERNKKLKLFLIEIDYDCYSHLRKVIERRFLCIDKRIRLNDNELRELNVYVLNCDANKALNEIENHKNLGRCLFFFDPLLFVEWQKIEQVAKKRIKTPFQNGTEFIIFLFTSDWFSGRGDFMPLPTSKDEQDWSKDEKKTVKMANEMFGNNNWKKSLLNGKVEEEREKELVNLYSKNLSKWFRFIVPMPFSPKEGQLYHLFFCSNFDVGATATRAFYRNVMGNPQYKPNNRIAFAKFEDKFPHLMKQPNEQRSYEWKILWYAIKSCEGGIIDSKCKINLIKDNLRKEQAFEFLKNEGFLIHFNQVDWAWNDFKQFDRFIVNWKKVKNDLSIFPPSAMTPIKKLANKKPKQKTLQDFISK